MLIFSKDIGQRDHIHELEDKLPNLKVYMEYQRKLFPYTVIRAGLDLAYKEVDDILNFVDNDYRPPADSNRQEYPSDVDQWYRQRFPWSSAFLKMEDLHYTLVTLVKAMDSFRTHETANSYHWAVLYDSVHNIIQVYNSLIREKPDQSRDIHLSNGVEVDFDDFINNYWLNLDFMIFSQADFPHDRHMERKEAIEEAIKQRMAEGEEPLAALENLKPELKPEEATLKLLRRDPVETRLLELTSFPETGKQYESLYQNKLETPKHGKVSVVDADYLNNHETFSKK
ncbi:MAG: hypothetical protein HOK41_05495 [Nitrospina sp.]|nr:hypothetical protein [Nitrospina sp.]MBT6716381.1 hypothetical protein [Nitrospina sp.]